MPLDDHNAQEHASDICRAIMRASQCDDRAQIAFDIVGCAALVAGDDPQTKSALAWFMLRMAQKLDQDVTNATTLQ